MAEGHLHTLVTLRARPEKVDELRETLLGLFEATRAEPGSISYHLWQNREDLAEFTFVEAWRDEEALGAHFETAHIQEALTRLPDLLASDMELRQYDFLA
jgi:quinol monooxygenase YgiN